MNLLIMEDWTSEKLPPHRLEAYCPPQAYCLTSKTLR